MCDRTEAEDVDKLIYLVRRRNRSEGGEVFKIRPCAEVGIDAGLLGHITNPAAVLSRTGGLAQHHQSVVVALHTDDRAHDGGFAAS